MELINFAGMYEDHFYFFYGFDEKFFRVHGRYEVAHLKSTDITIDSREGIDFKLPISERHKLDILFKTPSGFNTEKLTIGGRAVIEKMAKYNGKTIFVYQQSKHWLVCGYFNHPLEDNFFVNQFEARPLEYWGMLPAEEINNIKFIIPNFRWREHNFGYFPKDNEYCKWIRKEKIGKFGLYKNMLFNFDGKDDQFYYLVSSGDKHVEKYAIKKGVEYVNGIPYYLLPLAESENVELLFSTPLLLDPCDYGMGVTEAVYRMAHYRSRRVLIMYKGEEFFLAGFFNEPLEGAFFEGQFEPRPREYFGKIPIGQESEISYIA